MERNLRGTMEIWLPRRRRREVSTYFPRLESVSSIPSCPYYSGEKRNDQRLQPSNEGVQKVVHGKAAGLTEEQFNSGMTPCLSHVKPQYPCLLALDQLLISAREAFWDYHTSNSTMQSLHIFATNTIHCTKTRSHRISEFWDYYPE